MYIAETAADLPSRDQILAISGLDFMQKILSGDISLPPISGELNYRLSHVEPGKVTFTGIPLFRHTNPMGGVHGGWYGTLLDSCMACAVMTKVPKGSFYTTLEFKVNLTRAIPVGTEIHAIGTTQHVGRTTGVAEGKLIDANTGKLYATGTTTCLIMTP